jgi:hypothetical protein
MRKDSKKHRFSPIGGDGLLIFAYLRSLLTRLKTLPIK